MAGRSSERFFLSLVGDALSAAGAAGVNSPLLTDRDLVLWGDLQNPQSYYRTTNTSSLLPLFSNCYSCTVLLVTRALRLSQVNERSRYR